MNKEILINHINENVLGKIQIPYIDVVAYKGYEEVFRYGASKKGDYTGKEDLLMFSCTKPLTVACAMKLIEDGKLSLDQKLEDIIPAFKQSFMLDETGNKIPTPVKITVKHLLTMTAGFTYGKEYDEVAFNEPIKKGRETLSIVEAFAKVPLNFCPGTKFRYSLCHDVLGAVIEVVSGKKFSEFMKETIFDKLGMEKSYFSPRANENVADFYWNYEQDGIKPLVKVVPHIYCDGYESGGAGLVSTVEDYAKFALAMANDGKGENGAQILKPETIKDIYSPVLASISVNNGFTCVQGKDYGYGLGVRTRIRETEWGLPKGEFGWDGAAGSYLMVDPVNKVTVVVGMHIRNWTPIFSGEHLKIVELIYKHIL